MHPRNFGSGRIVRTEFVRPYVNPFMLADAKWHTWILFVENLVLDIPVLVSWQLQKRGIRWPVSRGCIAGSGVQLIEAA